MSSPCCVFCVCVFLSWHLAQSKEILGYTPKNESHVRRRSRLLPFPPLACCWTAGPSDHSQGQRSYPQSPGQSFLFFESSSSFLGVKLKSSWSITSYLWIVTVICIPAAGEKFVLSEASTWTHTHIHTERLRQSVSQCVCACVCVFLPCCKSPPSVTLA